MKSKLIVLLISLLVAFGLWFYVITVVSPDSEISINNVSVQSQGEKLLLEQSNLMVVTDMSDLEVDLVLNGNRTDLIKLSRSNITITVDVSKIDRAGKHEVTYDITLPGDIPSNAVSVQTRDPDRLTLVVENRVRNPEVPLKLVYDKTELPGNYTMKESAMEYPEFITVSGPESVMKNVAYAEAKLDLENRQESYIEESIPYVLYDKEGEEIESQLLTHDGTVLVTAPINYTKELPLKLQLKAGGGATEKDAVFSPWKGQRPNILAPLRRNVTYWPTTSSIGFWATSSSIKAGENAMQSAPFRPFPFHTVLKAVFQWFFLFPLQGSF